jgi:hypothetical protein
MITNVAVNKFYTSEVISHRAQAGHPYTTNTWLVWNMITVTPNF